MGGVIDRWEILSRIGAARYSKLSVSDIQPVEDLRKEYWSKLLEGCSTGEVPTLPDMDMLIGSATERLSEIGDLTKRFSLRKGKADQPGLVWALEGDLLCYPRPSSKASSELKTGDLRLISNTRKSRTEEAMTYIKEHGLSKKVQSLLQKGFLIEDPWGSVHAPFDDGRYEQKRTYRKGRTIRGLQQRAWLMRCANALGAFTFEDMREYSPEITDPSKLRWILRDLIGNGIKRLISFEPHPRAQYHIEGIDILEPETCDQREGNGIGIISPKDRMSRVISVDLPPWTTRGSGFTVLKDGRPVGLISMKKMKKAIKHTGFGGPSRMSGGMESYLIKKAWFDLRLKKGELLRDVKKAFFEMGCQVFTKPEKTRIESLYRDVEKTEREVQ